MEPRSGVDWQRTTYVVAATQIIVLVGFGVVLPFIPLYVQELGVHDRAEVAWWTGLLSGSRRSRRGDRERRRPGTLTVAVS